MKLSFQIVRSLVIAIVVVVIAIIAAKVSDNSIVRFMVVSVLIVTFVKQGFQDIPANQLKKAMPMIFGNFTKGEFGDGELLDFGWNFFPLYGLVFSYALIDVHEFNFTITLDERTPDNGEVHVEPFFSYIVDPEHPFVFLRAGDSSGVEQKLEERVSSVVRQWISSRYEGPQTWQETRQSNGLALDVIIEKLFPGKLHAITRPSLPLALSQITDVALIRYFTGKPPLYDPKNEGIVPGQHDQEWQKQLDELKTADHNTWKKLYDAVEERREATSEIKSGGQRLRITDLGIMITLVNLGTIDPVGKTAEAADKVAQAKQDITIKGMRADAYRKQIKKMLNILNDPKASTDAVGIQWELVKKDIDEKHISLDPGTLEVIKSLGLALANRAQFAIDPTTLKTIETLALELMRRIK
jgi:hypothetical protein